ncbi:unnamed protein product [Pelagomonas calceolata]|uniref:Uncharacterized protein n=1 Tax=Pelagomonas calceolata TaxID=35677 RepID=A0A8J2SG92_9STRA|nr:unnamed protein product [Pelagomonas calceolata]
MFHPKVRDGLSGQNYKLDNPIEILQGSGSVSTNQLAKAKFGSVLSHLTRRLGKTHTISTPSHAVSAK